ncbi:uncharacterized protein LOC124911548 isoform X2 [Impatiens glandulifera]|uniref:uncharacterized protein LOC124911548 isoform X2 n=1 Tax=Impatiens glandulifera TaxID=253017 RepID=UPI001FB0D03C|nr:uncharacterized protein LOC124911548 isoform X2 [Impatiens glandulifera]
MESRHNPDIDDDFSDIYKAYTGPVGSNASIVQDKEKTSVRSYAGSDEEEQRDPNAVPTDFTSREAKVWEAKSKATERNWKKRKEEEMICKICGIPGHFTQGCPSTLGTNRKSQDFLERIPAREKHVRALFTEKVVQKIEKEFGCTIKMDEKFIIVSGKDRLILKKGVDAVHKIKEEGEKKGSSSTHRSRSRSPERRSPLKSQYVRSDSQRSHSSPHNTSQFQHRFGGQDKTMESRIREDLQKPSRGSPQSFGVDGARGHSNHSKSPARAAPYRGNSYSSYDGLNQRMGAYRATDEWDAERHAERRVSDKQSGQAVERPAFPQLAELEMEYNREVMELEKIRDKEEDEEKYKHREAMKEMRETYIKKLSALRGGHEKQWEDFLHLDAQRRLEQARQQMSSSGFGGYKQSGYPDYENHAGNASSYGGGGPNNMSMDSRGGRYPGPMDNYHHPSRPHDNYSQFQRQRREDYGKAYDRY